MKILILGSSGMLGHQLVKSLRGKHEVSVTKPGFDVRKDDVGFYVRWYEPQVVINCIGIVKQRSADVDEMIEVNALFPHRLAEMTRECGARLIHISTDCVFSGRDGHYTESDEPDPIDLYGRTKLLGEVTAPGCLTLRTSLIGRELNTRQGLVEWFLSQHDEQYVPGFIAAAFTGVTTIEMGRIVEKALEQPGVHGLFHVGGSGISKYSLLTLLQRYYNKRVMIAATDTVWVNRCLDSSRFRKLFNYEPPTWHDMIKEMANAER